VLAAVGLNHRTAPVAQRELLAPREAEADLGALVALGGIDEVAVVSNCWRVEIYAATRCPAAAVLALREALTIRAGRALPLFALQGEEAFRHLVRVASALESPILGEAQVLSEVTAAFERAMDSGAAGIELASTLHRVLQVARRVRAEAAVGRADVSWGHAVAALAEKVLGPVAGRRVAVIGTGEIARVSGEHLRASGGHIVVLDRSLARAEALARELAAEARPLEALEEEILRADVVVSAGPAAPDAFGPARMARLSKARGRPLVLVDAAMPRAIPPETGDVPDVYLCDVDDLDRVLRTTQRDRRSEVARAERVIEQEVGRWARGDAEPNASRWMESSP
jgi:glutamyl-tRNA reductase